MTSSCRQTIHHTCRYWTVSTKLLQEFLYFVTNINCTGNKKLLGVQNNFSKTFPCTSNVYLRTEPEYMYLVTLHQWLQSSSLLSLRLQADEIRTRCAAHLQQQQQVSCSLVLRGCRGQQRSPASQCMPGAVSPPWQQAEEINNIRPARISISWSRLGGRNRRCLCFSSKMENLQTGDPRFVKR